MISREISSLQHPIVKHFISLRKSRSYRYENQSVCIVGNKMIEELSHQNTFSTILVEKGFPLPSFIRASQVFFVTPEILKKVSGVESPEQIVAEIPLPKEDPLEHKKFLLVLDQISDPGNLGTLLRSAKAFNWEGVFITESSCDPFNEKALRAAKGATFALPIRLGSWQDFVTIAKKNNMHCFVADPRGKSFQNISFTPPLALILSNESHGSSQEVKNSCMPICIPMEGAMESLNVAMAGSILLYNMKRSI